MSSPAWPPAAAPLGRGGRPDVVGFGEPLVLLQPPVGRTLASAASLDVHVAGAELNVCAAIAALGGSSVLCSRLGDDPLAAHVVTDAERLGVLLAIEVDPSRPTGVYFKDVQADGARRVYYYRSTSAASAMRPADADRGLTLRPRAAVVSGLTAALGDGPADMVRRVGYRAADYGCALVLDVNLRPQLGRLDEVHDLLTELLPRVDLLVIGTDESVRLLGTDVPAEVAKAALGAGCREVVVKAGADGCWWVDRDGVAEHLPSAARTVVDPVGAGDAFTGGYLGARLAGANAGRAARLASELAARVIASAGDTAGLPGREAGRRLLADLCS
ncbi:MAG TPA: sugar kinase [Jiangellaceae bacterium]|nr:sugar kinase [Jiangellaceae bacterium]